MKEEKKKELDLEELDEVTGGVGGDKCELFIPSNGISTTGMCKDCWYMNDGVCTTPDHGNKVR